MKIFIEASSMVPERMSGVGHTTLELTRSLLEKTEDSSAEIVLVTAWGKAQPLKRHDLRGATIKQLPPGGKILDYLLSRTNIPIPVDLLLGRGIYIFPNYKTWLTLFSSSITFIYDVAFRIFPDSIEPKNLEYLTRNMNRWVKRADKIVTISKSSRDELEQYYPAVIGKTFVLHLGVNPAQFYPRKEEEIIKIKEKYGIKDQYFLHVGNIEPRKNIMTLLEAYKKYADTVDVAASLVLIGGDGWNNDVIKSRLKSLKDQGYKIIKPDQYVDDEDLPAFYSGAKATILISHHEGYGLPLVEAQACGCSVVASQLPVFDEILAKKGVTYVDPNSVDDVAKGLITNKRVEGIFSKTSHTWATTSDNLLRLVV